MQKISIVGYGRFGKVLYKLLKDDFVITLYDKSKITKDSGLADSTTIAKDIREIYEKIIIFYAFQIELFKKIISSHRKYFFERFDWNCIKNDIVFVNFPYVFRYSCTICQARIFCYFAFVVKSNDKIIFKEFVQNLSESAVSYDAYLLHASIFLYSFLN